MPDNDYWCASAEPMTDATIESFAGTRGFLSFNSGSTGLPNVATLSGKKYIDAQDNSWFAVQPENASDTWSLGFRWAVVDTDTKDFLLVRDVAAGSMLFLRYTGSTGLISLMRGSTTLGTTTASVPNGAYIELSVVHHNTTGAATMRVNGVVQFQISGADTTNTANTERVSWRFQGPTNNSNIFYFTDFYFSPGFEEWFGPCVVPWDPVDTDLSPNEWDLVGASGDHFDALDNVPLASGVGIETTTAAEDEEFSFESVAEAGTPGIVTFCAPSVRPSSGTGTIQITGISGATEDAGDTQAPGDPNPIALWESWALDPDTSAAWDSTGVENFTVRLTSG